MAVEVCLVTGKVCHPGRGSAEKARRHHGERLHAYWCRECQRWHLGGFQQRRRRV